MPLYEHVFLARQDLAQAQVDALAENASKIITDHKGKVTKTETWGLRGLAYRIAKNRKAHYVMLELDAPAAAVAELERQTGINEDIIRFMTIRVPVSPRPRIRIRWEEEKGPKCLPAEGIARAFLSGPDSVDFLMRNRQLIRARLDSDCDGLDFYGSVYVQPEDHRICARRDSIRSRVGGSCRIEKFRTLVPKIDR